MHPQRLHDVEAGKPQVVARDESHDEESLQDVECVSALGRDRRGQRLKYSVHRRGVEELVDGLDVLDTGQGREKVGGEAYPERCY